MPWGAVAGAVVGAVANKALAPDDPGYDAANAADPFASQRSQYQTQLSTLMNGSFSTSDPSYQWRFDQGMEAVNRTKAAQGLSLSGNQLTALTDYGQNLASTEYANQYNRLSQLAGANVGSPAAAGQFLYNSGMEQQGAASAVGGTIGKAAGNYFSDWLNSESSGGNVDMTGFNSGSTAYSGYDWTGGGSSGGFNSSDYSSGSFGSGWMT